MFHRVKSENQNGQDETVKTAPPESVKSEETEAPSVQEPPKAEDVVVEAAVEQPRIQQNQTQTPKKDTQTMNQTQNNAAGNQSAAGEANTSTSSYQRVLTPSRPASAYPGSSYPGYTASQVRDPAAIGDRRLTIGAGITMSGEIECCDYLLVEGTVEAALKGANFLDIAESGVFYGTVEIDEATISGRFEGDITVHGRLTIASTGMITGSISYKELEVEAGAVIDGKLTPLSAVQESSVSSTPRKSQAAPKEAPASKARESKSSAAQDSSARPAPANSDGELFGKAVAAAE